MIMLRVLVKKQFLELFRSYFISRKTGKPQPVWKTALMFTGFGALMLFVAFMFFILAGSIGGNLIDMGFAWMYLSIMSILAILLGVFGSVFNTYAQMYLAKDNELLIPMPIPARVILLSRIVSVYGLSLMYSGAVWIPSLLVYWLHGAPGLVAILFGVLLTLINAMFITVITCALGWVVALISSKLKNKSVVTVIITIVLLGAYYFICFRMQDILYSLMENSMVVGETIRNWGNLIYHLGMAATGNVLSFIIFTLITLILSAVCLFIMEKSFFRMVSGVNAGTTVKAEYKSENVKQNKVEAALLKREWKHFTGSATYMLNAGLGIVFLLAAAVLAVIKADSLRTTFMEIAAELPVLGKLIPMLIAGSVCVLTSMNMITTPSISLEGKTLWQLKTMPIRPIQILNAKIDLQVLMNGITGVIAAVCMGLAFKLDLTDIMLMSVYIVLFCWIDAALGLIVGLVNPNFNWTSETQPIKQSVNTLIVMLGGWVLSMVIPGLYILVMDKMECYQYFVILIVVCTLIMRGIRYWLQTQGSKKFEEL